VVTDERGEDAVDLVAGIDDDAVAGNGTLNQYK